MLRLLQLVLLLIVAGCGEPESPPPETGGSEILDRITRPGDGGDVHLIRLVQHGDSYAFEPADLTIASGDVVRFISTGAQPESIAFDTVGATPDAAAFIRSAGLHRGVLLVEPGSAFDVNFPGAPPGTYPFQSIPHAALGMRGTIRITQ